MPFAHSSVCAGCHTPCFYSHATYALLPHSCGVHRLRRVLLIGNGIVAPRCYWGRGRVYTTAANTGVGAGCGGAEGGTPNGARCFRRVWTLCGWLLRWPRAWSEDGRVTRRVYMLVGRSASASCSSVNRICHPLRVFLYLFLYPVPSQLSFGAVSGAFVWSWGWPCCTLVAPEARIPHVLAGHPMRRRLRARPLVVPAAS